MNLAPEMLKLVPHVLVAKPFWPPLFWVPIVLLFGALLLFNSFNQKISERYNENKNFTYPNLLKAVLLKYLPEGVGDIVAS